MKRTAAILAAAVSVSGCGDECRKYSDFPALTLNELLTP